jgi:hypothetical protein
LRPARWAFRIVVILEERESIVNTITVKNTISSLS